MDLSGLSGNPGPSALSRQISANLDGFTRRSSPTEGARGPSERDPVGQRSLQAGRLYHEVSGKLAFEGMTPEELLGMEQYLHEFQQDMRNLVDDVRAGLATRRAPEALRSQGEARERLERLDESYLRLEGFVSADRDRKPARTEHLSQGARPRQSTAAREHFTGLLRQLPQGPEEQARLFKTFAESSATPAGRADLAAWLGEPEAARLLPPAMAALSANPQGRDQVAGFLSNLQLDGAASSALVGTLARATDGEEGRAAARSLFSTSRQDAAASARLVGVLARAGESPEGLANAGRLLKNVAGDMRSRHEFGGVLAKASETAEGSAALAGSFRAASRSAHGSADLVGILAGSSGSRAGVGPAPGPPRPGGSPPAAFGTPVAGRLAVSPPAAFGAPVAAQPLPPSASAPAASRPAGNPDPAPAAPPPTAAFTTPLLARVAADPALAASLTSTLASAAGTYEGRSRVAQLMESAAQEPSTARSFLAALGQTLETSDGKMAWGGLFEQGKAEVGGGFVRLASAAVKDAGGREAFDGLLRTVASDATTGHALRNQVTEQVRTPEGGAAVLALADRLAGDGDKQRNLVAFLFPPAAKAPLAGSGPPRDAAGEVKDAAALFGRASLSKEGAVGVACLLAGAVAAENGREVVADVFARLRRNTEARNDFLRAMALGLQDEEGAGSLRVLATEMNRTQEARDSVLRTLAQATTGEAGRSAMAAFTEELARRPASRDAMLCLLDSAVAGEGHRKTVDLLVRNLDQSPRLQEAFLGLVREAASTPKGQVEFRNLADFLGIQLPRPAAAQPPVATGTAGLVNPAAAKTLADRAVASGALFETQRPLAPGRRRTSDKVEEVKLEAHKRTAFDASDIFPASAFVSGRRCSNCGFQAKPDATTCPNCSGEGRQAVMRTEIRYNRAGALFPVEDLVEFTPTAFKLLAEGLLGVDRVVFLRFHQVAPKFKQLLEVVRIYR